MKLLRSTEEEITKENVPQVEIIEVVLVYCNNFNNQYQHDERVFPTFVPSKSLSQLLNISPTNHI